MEEFVCGMLAAGCLCLLSACAHPFAGLKLDLSSGELLYTGEKMFEILAFEGNCWRELSAVYVWS